MLLGLLGAPLLLVGAGLALAAGPDDVLMGKETPIEQGAAYSTPEAFAFDRLPVTVRVEAMGETYVGVGNPVDVLDVVEGTRAVEIARTPLTRVSGVAGSGEQVPDASQALWWEEKVSGSGTQELTVTLTGEPVAFLAASRDGTPIKVAFGYRIDGIFAVSLGIAGFGALLLIGALVLLLTGRRERPEQRQPPRPVPYVHPTHPTGHPAPPRPPAAGLYRRLGVAAGVGVLTFSLAGCSIPVAVEVEQVSKVSLPDDDVSAVIREWSERSDEAIEANRRGKWKAEEWGQAASGPTLAMFQAATVAAQGAGSKQRPRTFEVHAGRSWSVRLDEYPMWAVVEINGGGRRSPLAIYEQQDALSPWTHRGEVKVKASAIPTPVEGAAPVAAAEAKRVQDVADRIEAYLGEPQGIEGVAGLKKLRALRREMDAYVAELGVDTVRTTAEPFDETGLRMVQTPEGVLAMPEFTVDSIVGGQGEEWEWNPPYDRFRSQAGKNLSIRTAVTVAVLVPEDGDASVLGVEYGEIPGARVKN
ncbi:hypothetical protein UG56_017235 [Nocardioides luteus]|uniref:Uncharacterized protein n=1 Tax=Nocardioides luteus TaxID=1844 RepID=A0A1J4N1W1_9ACTN|nr:hypothetical protein UG56_017235 [Nocardioides luteus]